ncbi:MAG: bifunctional glutamate N-acetyltransferase/amino-acid acetyltransferase ArgJ [SAR324 cluster bacterium]|nr:bifunctional glutamate N-acetyltransferase/amino-acid acetyltransferase ArgJ [SAR324 cluster bacterium]
MVPGFSWFGKNIGIKDETLDFGGILSSVPCQAAGVFTRNTMPGAPVVVGKNHLKDGLLQAIIVNSKNANVATGERGLKDAVTTCQWVGEACGIDAELVLPSSTGVIGQYLFMEKFRTACQNLKADFGSTPEHAENFARSIMTTDTHPKWVSGSVNGASIFGVAKGSGMIEPNMATMLSYFVTDANIESSVLQMMLKRVVDQSFNRISIDTDTSTSDTVVIMSNGLAGDVDIERFEATLTEMAVFLAKELARDGEGATKLIELTVSGASTAEQALLTAKSVINSPLVKTAIYGADPNWGRFVMAIGKVFQFTVSLEELQIYFGTGTHRLRIDAEKINRDSVPLADISKLLKKQEIAIEIVLGSGSYSEKVWGCDLTEKYVEENAYYTT